MITSLHAAASVLALSILTASAGPVRAAPSDPIDCHSIRLPNMREVGERLDIHNFSETYAARTRLVQQVQRQCALGARSVQWVSDRAPVPQRELALAGK